MAGMMAQAQQAAGSALQSGSAELDRTIATNASAGTASLQAHELQNPTPEVAAQLAREQVARPDSNIAAGEEAATPEEQAEYERALNGLAEVLYRNDKTSQAVTRMLQPTDKIGSATQAVLLVITQLDQKLDLDETVFAQLTREAVDRVVELGEQSQQLQYSDEEVQAVLGASWEGILNIYQNDESLAADYEAMTQGMSSEELQAQHQTYKSFLGE